MKMPRTNTAAQSKNPDAKSPPQLSREGGRATGSAPGDVRSHEGATGRDPYDPNCKNLRVFHAKKGPASDGARLGPSLGRGAEERRALGNLSDPAARNNPCGAEQTSAAEVSSLQLESGCIAISTPSRFRGRFYRSGQPNFIQVGLIPPEGGMPWM